MKRTPMLRALFRQQCLRGHNSIVYRDSCRAGSNINSAAAARGSTMSHYRCVSNRGLSSSGAPKGDAEKTDEQLLEEHYSIYPKWASLSFILSDRCTVREFIDMIQFVTKYYFYSESEDYDKYHPVTFPHTLNERDHYWAMIKDDYSWNNIMDPFNRLVAGHVKKQGLIAFMSSFPLDTMHACEHALLRKYNFDIFEFMAGAKEAIKQINFVTTSKGFVDASAGMAEGSREDALLKGMAHPMFYRQSKEAMKEVSMHPVYMELEEIDVERVAVDGIILEIVTEEDVATRPKRVRPGPSPDSIDVGAAPASEPASGGSTASSVPRSLEDDAEALDYPVGSVVVTVQMTFKTNEKFIPRLNPRHPLRASLDASSLPFQLGHSMQHMLSNSWTFRGCVSGHVPLEWKVCGVGGVYFR